MASTAFARHSATEPFSNTPSRAREERPAKRKKEQRTDIWSNLLRQTREAQARSRTQAVQHRELLVCGGSPDDQRAFVAGLARPPPPAPPSRNRDQRPQKPKGEVRLSNRYAYGYGHVTLYSPPQQTAGVVGMLGAEAEEIARVEVHTLPEPDEAYEQTLRRLLEVKQKSGGAEDVEVDVASGDAQEKEARRPAVALLLSWKEPWRFLNLLRRWLKLLAQALLPPDDASRGDVVGVIKERKLSLTIVVQHVEAQEGLEREGYREESFDYISQCLRTCILPLSAGLVYTSSSLPPQQPGSALSEVQKMLFTSLSLELGPLSPAPSKGTTAARRGDLTPKHNVVDRMATVVPGGWDSAGKIRLLSETFSPEAVLEGWCVDLDTPLQTSQRSPPAEKKKSEEMPKQEQQADGGAEQHTEAAVYATSEIGDDEELSSRPMSPSKRFQSAVTSYEQAIVDPNAHKAPKPPHIEVTTKPDQHFLAEMRSHLQELEAQDAERAKSNPSMISTTAGSLNTGRIIGLPSGEQTGALNELGDVSFNVGGVSYNTVAAEAAIERLKRPQQPSSGSGADSPTTVHTPRTSTPRPPRREDREVSGTPQPPSTGSNKAGELPVEKLEEYFASLMKKGGGPSAGSTPSNEVGPLKQHRRSFCSQHKSTLNLGLYNPRHRNTNTTLPSQDPGHGADVAHDLGQLKLEEGGPPRTNLPIPRELRDQIYHYLLSSEYAKDGTTYHFHTNIIAVNRTIGIEAEEYLYKHNIFVVVSYKWLDAERALLTAVPVVATKMVGRMRHHSLRFHTTVLPSKLALQTAGGKLGPEFADPPLHSLLMLIQDVEKLGDSFQLRSLAIQGPVVYITSTEDHKLGLNTPRTPALAYVSAILELRQTRHTTMTSDLQSKLLLPFKSFVAEGQKVSFRGAITDAVSVRAMRSIMGPILVCMQAKQWALYENGIRHKANCDALVNEKQFEKASMAYKLVLQKLQDLLTSVVFALPGPGRVSYAILALNIMLADLWISSAWLSLREGDLVRLTQCLNALAKVEASEALRSLLSTQCLSAYRRLCVLASLYVAGRTPQGGDKTVIGVEMVFRHLTEQFPEDEWLARDSHELASNHAENIEQQVEEAFDSGGGQDRAAAKRVFDASLQLPAISALPLEQCSARQLEPRIYDSTSAGRVPKKPDSIVGWQDKEQLANLSADDKAAINKLQKENRIQITSFA
ncbi:hypothetical protein LTR85_011061 [Meristemomyces frigidus]|nr:hypothetical protein LTR85_011061 [Meristemomyces frigidus]